MDRDGFGHRDDALWPDVPHRRSIHPRADEQGNRKGDRKGEQPRKLCQFSWPPGVQSKGER